MIDFCIDNTGDFVYDVLLGEVDYFYGTGICWDVYTNINLYSLVYGLRIYVDLDKLVINECLL